MLSEYTCNRLRELRQDVKRAVAKRDKYLSDTPAPQFDAEAYKALVDAVVEERTRLSIEIEYCFEL